MFAAVGGGAVTPLTSPAVTPAPTPKVGGDGAPRPTTHGKAERLPQSFAVDAIRVGLTLLVTYFHALSELTWMLTLDEVDALLRHPVGRLIPLGYTAVDGFMVLTGLLSMQKMVATWGPGGSGPPTLAGLTAMYYNRMVKLGLPLVATVAWYALFFRAGKYPDAAVRSEAALLTMRLLRNDTAAYNDGRIAPDGALTTIRDTQLSMWPWMALYVSNMSPFGGLLQQTWSLAVQMQWYLWTPLIPYILYAVRRACAAARLCAPPPGVTFTARDALIVCTGGALFSGAWRVVAHRHLSQFNPSSLVGFASHFFWYASTFTRAAPLFIGGIAGILCAPAGAAWRAWFAGTALSPASALRRNAVVAALSLNVFVVCAINAFWKDMTHADDEGSRAWYHRAMYVLFRPGSNASAFGYAWVVLSAMHGFSWLPVSPGGGGGRGEAAAGSDDDATEAAAAPPPAAAADRPRRRSWLRTIVTALVPITYSVYLVNSTLYEQFYGWPQRLHPCPTLLHPRAVAISDTLIHTAPLLRVPRAEAVRAGELRLIDGITSALQWARGPADLYCRTNATTGAVACNGLCFSSEKPDIMTQVSPSCMLDHSCTMLPSGHPKSTLSVPVGAWLQFLHYGSICVVASWALATAFFFLIEVPLGTCLLSRPVKAVMQLPVMLHVLACLAVSIPAHVYINFMMITKLTPEFEHNIMHAHFT